MAQLRLAFHRFHTEGESGEAFEAKIKAENVSFLSDSFFLPVREAWIDRPSLRESKRAQKPWRGEALAGTKGYNKPSRAKNGNALEATGATVTRGGVVYATETEYCSPRCAVRRILSFEAGL